MEQTKAAWTIKAPRGAQIKAGESDILIISWPGVNIHGTEVQLNFSLIRMTDETQEAFVKRCQDVVNYALSFAPQAVEEVWNFDDTSRFRKVGETSYEMVTQDDKTEK